MKMTAPKGIVFCISVILIVCGAIVQLTGLLSSISLIGGLGFWLVLAGGVLLSLGCLLKGL